MTRFPLVLFIVVGMGCHKQAQVKAPQSPVAQAPTPAPAKPEAPRPASPNVAVSDDLAAQCKLQLDNAQHAPKFDFDQAELLPEDRDVLQQVATCLTSGPLKGKKLELVGRADPRGTEEYNLGLGTRRSNTVASYLARLGVQQRQLAETTRGALDATGTDDSTWRTDRRVDLRVAN